MKNKNYAYDITTQKHTNMILQLLQYADDEEEGE